jgi:hypothetical protein
MDGTSETDPINDANDIVMIIIIIDFPMIRKSLFFKLHHESDGLR